MRFLILAHDDDLIAAWVAQALVARHGPAAVKLVTGEALALAPRWLYRLGGGANERGGLGAAGAAEVSTEIRLVDGTVLADGEIGVVFNRLRYVSLPHFAGATPGDRDYAVMETYALWLSWLAGLPCPVINPVSPRGLGGQGRSPAEWLYLAGRAGLPAQAFFFSSDPRAFRRDDLAAYDAVDGPYPLAGQDRRGLAPVTLPQVNRQPTYFLERLAEDAPAASVLVAGGRAVGELAATFAGPLAALRDLAGLPLLQVDFGRTAAGEWRVVSVNPLPMAVDPAWLEAIVGLLEESEDEVGASPFSLTSAG